MALDNIQIALRLLEAIYLLLPVVAILLQTMISYYTTAGDSVSPVRQTKILWGALLGFVVLVLSGLGVIGFLFSSGVNGWLILVAIASLFGLAAFGYALGKLVTDVLNENQQ